MFLVGVEWFDLTPTSQTDLDKISDELEREATVGIIHNCEYMTPPVTMLFLSVFQSDKHPRNCSKFHTPSALFRGHIRCLSCYSKELSRIIVYWSRAGRVQKVRSESICHTSFKPLSDLGAGCPVHSIFVDSVGGIGAYPMGVVSVPPYMEEQVEWYSQGGRSDEVRIIADRKVCTLRDFVLDSADINNPGGSSR